MSNEHKTIHDFDFSLICEYYSSMERQGPGSVEMTIKALSFVDNLIDKSLIADLGCGTGGQTMTLAKHIEGQITALDMFPDFINILNSKVEQVGLQNKVKGIVGSMDNLPFQEEELDLLWCEGAIYNVGFDRGLNEWRKYLKTGGYIAVSEASWFTDKRPDEIEQFWMDAYPEIDTIPNQVDKIYKAGYLPIATFVFPETCWTDNFYAHHSKAQDIFLKKYAGNKTAEEFIASEKREAVLYRKYKQFYGYTFFIAKKAEL